VGVFAFLATLSLGTAARASYEPPVVAPSASAETPPLVGRPLDVSTEGHRSDFLFDVTAISATVLFVMQLGIMIWAVLKYREETGSRPHYDHGAGRKDLLTIGVVSSTIFVIVDVTLLYFSFRDVNGVWWSWPTDPNTLKVEVVAQQWAWNVRYAGPDGKFNTDDDIVMLNDLRVPTGRPVHVRLRSADVIHSFYLPNFRTKQDAMPGMTTQLWFQAKDDAAKAGGTTYDIGCAQHCGANHYKMHGVLTVYTPKEFDAWYDAAVADAKRSFDATDVAAHWGWDWDSYNKEQGSAVETPPKPQPGEHGEHAEHSEGGEH
jgi:cytochrome c oxidase subunit 2